MNPTTLDMDDVLERLAAACKRLGIDDAGHNLGMLYAHGQSARQAADDINRELQALADTLEDIAGERQ